MSDNDDNLFLYDLLGRLLFWLERGAFAVIQGTSGIGKSMMAIQIGIEAALAIQEIQALLLSNAKTITTALMVAISDGLDLGDEDVEAVIALDNASTVFLKLSRN
jgi:hypothetical protein